MKIKTLEEKMLEGEQPKLILYTQEDDDSLSSLEIFFKGLIGLEFLKELLIVISLKGQVEKEEQEKQEEEKEKSEQNEESNREEVVAKDSGEEIEKEAEKDVAVEDDDPMEAMQDLVMTEEDNPNKETQEKSAEP
ncbi:uncharacterized protein LOC131600620 [Vicia villosa]|uniref:uncharacterized protein LOC131600620 n=1 Tax=Vicia villosa TaxID=3911 RepID=UPI00273A9C94|nr:uncharacterized protein LOC131600620 [Vicia villosa]